MQHDDLVGVNSDMTPLGTTSRGLSAKLQQVIGPKYINKGFYNVVILGVCFFFLFAAFGTTQSFITTIRKSEGFVSLSILYFVFAFSNFFAPSFCQVLTPKWALIIGALCYCFFVFAAGFESSVLFYSASVVNGFGAALLWTAQGTLLTQSANIAQVRIRESQTDESKKSVEVMGFFSGIFFAIFQTNFIFGNILAGSLFGAGLSNFGVFMILAIIATVGAVTMIALRSIKQSEIQRNVKDEGENQSSSLEVLEGGFLSRILHNVKIYFTENLLKQVKDFVSLLKQSFMVLFSLKMLVFSVISFYSGYNTSYFTGSLPPIIGKQMLGWVMILFGIMQVVGALISGKMADHIGRRVTMRVTMVIHCIALALSTQMVYWGNNLDRSNGATLFYLGFFIDMALFGLADSFLTNTIYAILGSKNYYKKKNTSEAFAAFKMTQALSSAIGFFCGIYLKIFHIQIIVGCAFFCYMIAFFVLDTFIAPVDSEKKATKGMPKKDSLLSSNNNLNN